MTTEPKALKIKNESQHLRRALKEERAVQEHHEIHLEIIPKNRPNLNQKWKVNHHPEIEIEIDLETLVPIEEVIEVQTELWEEKEVNEADESGIKGKLEVEEVEEVEDGQTDLVTRSRLVTQINKLQRQNLWEMKMKAKTPLLMNQVNIQLKVLGLFWFDKRMRRGKPVTGGTVLTPVPLEDYQSNLKQVGTFKAVEDFWSLYHHMMPPSQLELNSNYHLFKTSIQPMWEDPANHKGGKWTIRIPSRERHNTNACWRNVLLAMVGEMLDAEEDDDVCGAVFSRRRGGDRISLWTRKQDRSKILTFGHRLRDVVTADLFGTPVSPTTGTTSSATTAATFDFVYDYHDDAIQNAQGPHIPGTGENPRSRYPRQISLE